MPAKLFRHCVFLLGIISIAASAQQLTYQVGTTIVGPGDTVVLPNTNVGDTGSVTVQVRNNSATTATLGTIGVSGAGFQLAQAPPLPATLASGSTRTFTISFTPTKAGTATGTLTINSDSLLLSGVGLGPQLNFSWVVAGTTITLSPSSPSVVFSPALIGQTVQLAFDVKNTGTLPAVISNIGIAQANSPFSVTGTPPLPITLAAGADIPLAISFRPTALGFSNGTLQIDSTAIPLIGSGTEAPALPTYTISGASGQVTPRTQPKISLTLGSPYPVAIAGTLTLSTSGNLPNDPAVQFSNGGRVVSFVIPANATSAAFGSSGTSSAFQTGTVASTITFTPTFATQSGQIDLTPANPTTLQVTVAPAVPTLIGIQLTGNGANGFSIVVTGFSTPRTLTTWSVQFVTAAGFKMAKSQFTIDIQQASSLWFQSNTSQSFGGQFTITVPFAFQGTLPSGASFLSAISSVSVNVNNELGSSNTVQAKLQ